MANYSCNYVWRGISTYVLAILRIHPRIKHLRLKILQKIRCLNDKNYDEQTVCLGPQQENHNCTSYDSYTATSGAFYWTTTHTLTREEYVDTLKPNLLHKHASDVPRACFLKHQFQCTEEINKFCDFLLSFKIPRFPLKSTEGFNQF